MRGNLSKESSATDEAWFAYTGLFKQEREQAKDNMLDLPFWRHKEEDKREAGELGAINPLPC